MTTKDIQQQVSDLWVSLQEMQEALEENGGEITSEIEEYQEAISKAKDLLTTEGVDCLGRAMSAMDAEIETIKGERDFLSRQIKRKEGLKDYLKGLMAQVMDTCEIDRVKGAHGYLLTAVTSTTTEVNKDELRRKYLGDVLDAVRNIVPNWVTVELKASSNIAAGLCGNELPSEFTRTSKRTITMRSPRQSLNNNEKTE